MSHKVDGRKAGRCVEYRVKRACAKGASADRRRWPFPCRRHAVTRCGVYQWRRITPMRLPARLNRRLLRQRCRRCWSALPSWKSRSPICVGRQFEKAPADAATCIKKSHSAQDLGRTRPCARGPSGGVAGGSSLQALQDATAHAADRTSDQALAHETVNRAECLRHQGGARTVSVRRSARFNLILRFVSRICGWRLALVVLRAHDTRRFR
jgi:hypothetical protein